MKSCNSCGQCRFILGPKMKGAEYTEICPIYSRYKFDSYSGQGLINVAEELMNGELAYDNEMIAYIYTCLTCGACDINCKSVRDMEVLDTILALRAKCVEDGQGPLPVHKETAENVRKSHNVFGLPHNRRFDWLPDGAALSEESDTVYFAGCSASYKYPEIAGNTVKILNAAGIAFSILKPDEFCCGALLWRTGQMADAVQLVEKNIETFKKRGIKKLIVSCGECYGTFRGLYPRIKSPDFQVLHISQVVQETLEAGKLPINKKLNMKVTYHDPCLLGRLSELYTPWEGEIKAFGYHDPPKTWRRGTHGEYDAPRNVILSLPGTELVEMVRNEENGFCCGGGGGVPAAMPEFASWTGLERLGEAESTGAEAIVSCCPWCQASFTDAIERSKSSMHYYDLTELVSMTL
jgi:Fe-S oxidoreductase